MVAVNHCCFGTSLDTVALDINLCCSAPAADGEAGAAATDTLRGANADAAATFGATAVPLSADEDDPAGADCPRGLLLETLAGLRLDVAAICCCCCCSCAASWGVLEDLLLPLCAGARATVGAAASPTSCCAEDVRLLAAEREEPCRPEGAVGGL